MQKVYTALAVLGVLSFATPAYAGDVASGKQKAAACAACHGVNGISLSGDIPNLAGQKEAYVAGQLSAFKAGKRKNAIMQAVASQLSSEDIGDLAAFWNSLPGTPAPGTAMLAEKLNKTRVTFPTDYGDFKHYRTRNVPAKKQVRKTFANPIAVAAAKDGKPLPSRSTVIIEIYKAKLDDKGKPVTGSDGFYVADSLALYSTMQKQTGWGNDIDKLYRNGDWNHALFTVDEKLKTAGFIPKSEIIDPYEPNPSYRLR